MRGAIFTIVLLFIIPLVSSISIKDLISRYSFSSSTPQMAVTNIRDFMIDSNNNGKNDTLVFELTTNNSAGNFIFDLNLFDKNGIITNETTKTLSQGVNKLNISFSSIFLSDNQFYYSIKVYNSSFSLKFRKDNLPTQNYANYEQGFKIIDVKDWKENKTLKINITLDSSVNGMYDTALFLSYNDSIRALKDNKTMTNSKQDLIFVLDNETLKRTHYAGSFNITNLKIGGMRFKINYTTKDYDFRDFAASSYIESISEHSVDLNENSKYDALRLNITAQIMSDGAYTLVLDFYDLFGSLIETKNITLLLNSGRNIVYADINGSIIYGKKLNGPYIVKHIGLFDSDSLTDEINDAYITKNYNFNDFESPSLPDILVEIKTSEGFHYGADNATVNFTFRNIGSKPAFNLFVEISGNNTGSKTFDISNKSEMLGANSQISFLYDYYNITDFEINAIADLQDFIEESNESNNIQKVVIKQNKKPELRAINNFTINETEHVIINLSATDQNNDALFFSINSSRFLQNSNFFVWKTKTTESGNYTFNAAVSDGYLSDSKIFQVAVLDAPEKDVDDDDINDSIDKLIGNEKSVNTSTINLSIFVNNSRNLSRLFNESVKVNLMDGNATIAEFDFDFANYKLNLSNLSMSKQSSNSTGWFILKGLQMPLGRTKSLYLDRLNAQMNGICIKDGEISSINEISNECNSFDEFKVECDGTLQSSYTCIYNSTLNKYKVYGLKHSGIEQINYVKTTSSSSESSSISSSSSGGGSGGGGSLFCENCNNNNEKQSSINKANNEINQYNKTKQDSIIPNNKIQDANKNKKINELGVITGQSIKTLSNNPNFDIALALILIALISFFTIRTRIFLKIFK